MNIAPDADTPIVGTPMIGGFGSSPEPDSGKPTGAA